VGRSCQRVTLAGAWLPHDDAQHDKPEIRKLRLLLLRLASDASGEVVATVAAIRRTLAASGMDIHDLAAMIGAPASPPAPSLALEPVRMARASIARAGLWKPVELDFLANAARLGAAGWLGLSEKQATWLRYLYQRAMLGKEA
jgi:hypothetical protein